MWAFLSLIFIKKFPAGSSFKFLGEKTYTPRAGFLGEIEIRPEKNFFLKVPGSGYRYPKIPYPFVSYKEKADIRILWELNRLQFLPYYAKNNPEFAKKILDVWMKDNKFPYGPNWTSTMEVAIRAINLIIASNYIEVPSELLYKHKIFIERNLERGRRYTSNHYITDLAGLLALAIYFLDEAKAEFAINELEKEINIQFENGIHFEGSTYYHKFAFEVFLVAYLLAKERFSKNFHTKLATAAGILNSLKINSKLPQIGDNDSGSILPVWKSHENVEELLELYLKNSGGIRNVDIEQGIYLYRDENVYLLISNIPYCIYTNSSHMHNDRLSFYFAYKNREFFVDPGTYTYTADTKLRNRLRSTSSHNTVEVNNSEQSEFKGIFSLNYIEPFIIRKFENEEYYVLISGHNGYLKRFGIIHTRRFEYNKKSKVLKIRDSFSGNKKAILKWSFVLSPECSVVEHEKSILIKNGDSEVLLETGNTYKTETWLYSPYYSMLQKTKKISWVIEAGLPFSHESIIRCI